MKYQVLINDDGAGGLIATSPDVPGLVANAKTLGETLRIAGDVCDKLAESCREHGDPLPDALACE